MHKDKSKTIKYNNQFNKEAYDRLSLMVPKGTKDIIKAHALVQKESVNGFINRAIKETLQRDAEASGSKAN